MAGVEGLPVAEADMEEEVMIEGDMALLEVAIVEDIVADPEDTHRIKNSEAIVLGISVVDVVRIQF